MFGELGKDQKGWGLTTLGECCEVNPKRPRNIDDELMVSFVPMPAVSEDGKIDCSDIKPYKEVRKGFTYFAENDVLFAKITPCMENGKGAVAFIENIWKVRASEILQKVWNGIESRPEANDINGTLARFKESFEMRNTWAMPFYRKL